MADLTHIRKLLAQQQAAGINPIQSLLNQAQRSLPITGVKIPGVGAGVLTGQKARVAAEAAFAEAASQFGPMMEKLGRTPVGGFELFEALQKAVGGRGELLFQKTKAGGFLGLRYGGEDIILPTQYGTHLLAPTTDAMGEFAPAVKVLGTHDELEFLTRVADKIRRDTNIRRAGAKKIRSQIMRELRDHRAVWPALGHQMDFLRANTNYMPEFAEALEAARYDADALAKIVMQAQSKGAAPMVGNPAQMFNSIFPRVGVETLRPIPTGAPAGKQLYQDVAFAPLVTSRVDSLEAAIFGSKKRLPRLRTALDLAVAKAYGADPQGVLLNVGILDPSSKLGKQLTRGLGDTEQILLAESLRGKAASGLRFVSGGKEEQVTIGTGVKIAGRSFRVGGFVADAELAGTQAVVIARNLYKDPNRYVQAILGDAIYNSLQLSTGRLPRGFSQKASQLGLGTISTAGVKGLARRGEAVIFTPSQALKTGQMDMGTAQKKVQRLIAWAKRKGHYHVAKGIKASSRLPFLERLTMEVNIRGELQRRASYRAATVNPMDFLSMSAMGKESARYAQHVLDRAISLEGDAARGFFGFFHPFLGKDVSHLTKSNLFKAVKPGQVRSSLIQRLKTVKTQQDVNELMALLPDQDILLKLSKSIKIPTGAFFRADDQIKAFYDVSELPLPSLHSLRKLAKDLEPEIAEKMPAFLPKYARKVGQVLEAAAEFEATSDSTKLTKLLYGTTADETKDSLLGLMAGHMGRNKLAARLLKPRIGDSVYAGILEGWSRTIRRDPLRTLAALPEVAAGEVGISPRMAYRLGLSRELVREIQAGMPTGREYFIHGQYWPSIVPEASRAYKLKIWTRDQLRRAGRDPGIHHHIATNISDRLLAFRDLDYDKMRLAFFGGAEEQALLRDAWKAESVRLTKLSGRIQDFLKEAGASPRSEISGLAGLLKMEEAHVKQLFSTKVLAGKEHDTARLIQEALFRQFGPGKSADAFRAVGVGYQVAGIKKGKEAVYDELFNISRRIGKAGSMREEINELRAVLTGKLSDKSKAYEVFLGLGDQEARIAAVQIAKASREVNKLSGAQRHQRLANLTRNMPKGVYEKIEKTLGILGGAEEGVARAPGLMERFFARVLNMGRTRVQPGVLESNAAVRAMNTALKQAGAAKQAAGGIWARLSMPWKIGIGAVGGLLGLRVLKSTVFGDEPSAPAEPPLPPEPVGMPGGMHDQLSRMPLPPMSIPAARVVSPLQHSPRVTINATAQQGLDFAGLGEGLATAAMSPAGPPLAGIFHSNVSSISRIDDNIAEGLRAENRLYA